MLYEVITLGCGFVVVPLYTDDRPENTAYIINNSGATLLFLQGENQWQGILEVLDQLGGLVRILTLEPVKVPAHVITSYSIHYTKLYDFKARK